MKKFLTLLALFALTSCFTANETYEYYDLYAFGSTVSGATLRLDITGDIFHVTEDQTDSKWMHEQTLFFFYDILGRTADGEYNIRLKTYKPVTRRMVRTKSESGEAEYGTDAVCFYQDWGFNPTQRTFDIACLYTSRENSETEHEIYLVLDDVRSNADTLYLELHHQGHGESYENETYESKDFQVNNAYLRFDLGGVLPADAGKQIVFTVEWDWFPTDKGILVRERKHFDASAVVTLSE